MKDRLLLGIDEAGKGCVIGPLVICGALIRERNVGKLISIGVKDSKQLTKAMRNRLKEKITSITESYRMIEVFPSEIDKAVQHNKLNVLEAQKMAEIIDATNPDEVYIDSLTFNPNTFLEIIKRFTGYRGKIKAEIHADEKYPIVMAASILAKVRRDEIINMYCKKYGEVGSGYPSDEKTLLFLAEYYIKNQCFPKIMREKWETKRTILERIKQKKMAEYL